MTSIRKRLRFEVLAGMLAVWLICGAILYAYMLHALTDEFDDRTAELARTFSALSSHNESRFEHEEVASLDALSPAVRETIESLSTEGEMEEIERVIRDGQVFFKVEMENNDIEREFLVSGTGQYLGVLDEFAFAFSRASLPEYQPGPDAAYFQVWEEDGEVLARSPSLGAESLVSSNVTTLTPGPFDVELPDARRGRAFLTRFQPQTADGSLSDESVTLVMARSRADLDRVLAIMLSGLLIGGLVMAVLAAAIANRVVHRGLVPLDRLTAEAAAIDAQHLTRRFSTDNLPSELAPIAARLNELLDGLEQSFERERRFTSDVAHELRTPIAELRTLAEVGLRFDRDRESADTPEGYLSDALAISKQMEGIVSHLLALRRCESGKQTLQRCDTDLVALMQRTWRPFAQSAADRTLRTDFDLPSEAHIETDPALLTAILSNLFSNAVSYSPDGGVISVRLKSENGDWRLDISNANVDLEAQDVRKMTEPFWRKDAARSDATHSGLGLSLVSAFAEALGADFEPRLADSKRFQVSLTHPKKTA